MICPVEKCTGCGACAAICEKKAIVLKEDSFGAFYPFIDENKCIICNLCKKVCPNNQDLEFKNVTDVYAAYSLDKEIYSSSASGGIASELYKAAIESGCFVMGTCFERNAGVFFKEVKRESDLKWACSSKYVYSDMTSCFKTYFEHLESGKNALFIGLPCQCAALHSYINLKNKKLIENLCLVNLICHGVPNWKYLDEHLSFIESKCKNKTVEILFRSKTLYESQKAEKSSDYHMRCISYDSHAFYVRDMHKNETFGNAFIKNLIFRDNCYSCSYARPERFSDLTIGDYDGLGCETEYKNPIKHVSCILVSSNKGKELLNNINRRLYIESRPVSEPFLMNGQLNHPSVAHKNRSRFKKNYSNTGNFELAVKKSLFRELYLSFDISGKIKSFIKRNFHFVYAVYKNMKVHSRGSK